MASTYSRTPVQLDRSRQSPTEPFSPQPWLRLSPVAEAVDNAMASSRAV